jgi:hypothetical protein
MPKRNVILLKLSLGLALDLLHNQNSVDLLLTSLLTFLKGMESNEGKHIVQVLRFDSKLEKAFD